MRFSHILLVGVMVGGFGNLPTASIANPPDTQFSCLRQTLSACKAFLLTHYAEVSGIDAVAASWGKTDVSGNKVLGQTRAYVTAKKASVKPHLSSSDSFTFNLNEEGIIWNIVIDLELDPAKAQTESEYRNTNVYSLSKVFIPVVDCSISQELSFYRFFNENIKPTIEGPMRAGFVGVGSATDEYQYRSRRVPICGAYIDYRRDTGVSTTYMNRGNPSGKFDNIKLIIWSEPSPVP